MKFRKKPVVIEATQWFQHGDHPAVKREILSQWATEKVGPETHGLIETLEGDHMVSPGDWVITGVAGEHYPCKPEIFAATYEPANRKFALSFSEALSALKAGAAVAREGWNGKGMWIALTPGSAFEAKYAKCGHAAAKRASEILPDEEIELLPHIDMRAADGSMVIGWLASQTDMLAEDWMIVAVGEGQ
ncbi:DUF2829 domain-containing protein [Palleronia pelagia]|uniref:Thoeris anti-defense 2-like domain-containing protein n=1 Tax=Palleronia pelagia TaxID=387096 RepID=A0A1H8HXB3_9RHOB|nr:DUF2829 domain-containing protein [Palleronia pelagia]SEN60615.1 Protein of unknown function [Palleronia pelagia]